MTAALTDLLLLERAGILGQSSADEVLKLMPLFKDLGGQFLLDPNEFNGYGVLGPFDNVNSQDLGNVGAAVNRLAGGFVFPFDVKLTRFFAWHYNSNAAAQAWGWRIARQAKTADSNVVANVDLLAEVADNGGTGPRDYGNTITRLTDITFVGDTIPAGEVVVLGVESPTANATNYYARILAGYLQFQRV